ncbi:MAG: TolC family protein [Sedimentisphaerales bacterium]|nr:TolC family protein [Sedimentisphaerales bacterium]
MMGTSHYREWLPLACLAGLAVLTGCGPKSYKGDADQRVYKFVDRKWEPEFGPRANYRITGAPPSPNDLDVELVFQIEQIVSQSRILTIPQAVAIATVHNRDYHLQKERLYTMALDMRLVRHVYETQLFGGGLAEYSNDEKNGDRQEEIAVEPSLGFNRLLAIGTLISAQVGARWVDILSGSGDGGLSSVLTATVTQPLLRGNKPRVVLEPLTLAERNALYEIRNIARFRKLVVVTVITQYYEALKLQETMRNIDAHINSLLTLENRVERLVEVALLPREELDQARQEILRARDARIPAQKEYERSLDSLKMTLGVRPTMEFDVDAHVFETLKAEGIPYPDFTLNDAIETALYHRLDLTNNADMVLDAQRGVYATADGLRPGVDVFGGTRLDSNGSKTATAGLTLDLDHVPEQDLYVRALVLLNQRQREYDLTADTIRMEVREAHRKMLEAAERYEVLSEGLRLARERVEKTFAALRYAKLSSRRVLTALEHLQDARNQAAGALTDYAAANLDFYRDTEILQVRPDGMWEIGPLENRVRRAASQTD